MIEIMPASFSTVVTEDMSTISVHHKPQRASIDPRTKRASPVSALGYSFRQEKGGGFRRTEETQSRAIRDDTGEVRVHRIKAHK